ncbi:E3 ubiquitin-protein ligase TRIM38-like [Sorex fumeus]|uniref:E3 ubiquitin-protein ligase TRIM38-like n=1 Tax=Sorex fumeus TaxID=62283 RepID=UPI0024AE6D8C|nr:E3 ubiquitin-protein ligase TRIM38-like [Sorex fumeus]
MFKESMTLAKATKELKQEDTCHLCQKLMTEPVSITLGHIYCQGYILMFTEEQAKVKSSRGSLGCPLCSLPFQVESIRPVKQLSSLIEIIKGMQCENLNEEHREQLHLFCKDEEQLICWHCERTQHKGHSTCSFCGRRLPRLHRYFGQWENFDSNI